MSFIDEVQGLSNSFADRLDHLDTEEATKHALVLPFIQLLGYDTHDPTEVVPEFTADVGVKKDDKVDYALLQSGEPVALFECKTYGTALNEKHVSQLMGYFSNTDARFGVLTDGIVYRFFADLVKPNLMDSEPFFEFNMFDNIEAQVEELERFTKSDFHTEANIEAARRLKYTTAIKRVLTREFANPSKEFVKLIVRQVYEGKLVQKVQEQFDPLVRRELALFATEKDTGPRPVPPVVKPDPPKPLPPFVEPGKWCPLSTLNPAKGGPKPIGVRFPDGSHRPIKNWSDLMVEVAGWLIRERLMDSKTCTIKRSGRSRRFLVSAEPIHPNGKPFTQPHQVESLYIEGNYSAPNHAKNTHTVIEHVGQNPAEFAVRFD